MNFFKFSKSKYPTVPVALHAGEIALGMVQPEHMRFHIFEAVTTGGAKRIGHGCDLSFEDGTSDILRYMQVRAICDVVWRGGALLGGQAVHG